MFLVAGAIFYNSVDFKSRYKRVQASSVTLEVRLYCDRTMDEAEAFGRRKHSKEALPSSEPRKER